MVETILTVIIAFVSTNVDDIFILMTLFTQVPASLSKRDIYAGQYLGISALIVLSILGSFIGIVVPKEYIGLLGLFPIYLGFRKIYEYYKQRTEVEDTIELGRVKDKNIISRTLISVQILSVASITIANGGDNIGIYIPLFTTFSVPALVFTVIIFLLLTYVWLRLARYLVHHPLVANGLRKYQPVIFPIILIGLGTYILIKNYTYKLF